MLNNQFANFLKIYDMPTAGQLRIAKIVDQKPDEEIKNKIKQVMQVTQKTKDKVVMAFNDALLEGPQESWSATGKKKKNQAINVTKKNKEDLMKNDEADGDTEWDKTIRQAVIITTQNSGGVGKRHRRGRKKRENKDNEKNLAENDASGEKHNFRSDNQDSRRCINRPRYNNRPRDARMFQNSECGSSGLGCGNKTVIGQLKGTWINPIAKESKKENCGTFPSHKDWDNEDYTDSLAGNKVLTLSGETDSNVKNEVEVPKPNENACLEVKDWNYDVQAPNQQAVAVNNAASEKLAVSIAKSKTLTRVQTQYLSSLTQESQQKHVVPLPTAGTTFKSHPPVEFVSLPFEENLMGSEKKPTLRACIPSHSKIPLSAVEMPPDDSNDNINFLDVSFGGIDLSVDIPELCDPSQEQNSLPPVVKYEDSISQKVDTVLTQTEHSTISNQASVQTLRSPQVNQAPQPSTKIGPLSRVSPPAYYLTKHNAAVVNPIQNIYTGQPISMFDSSVNSNNPQGLSSHTSFYDTTGSNIDANSTNLHIPQLPQSNHSILNAYYPQIVAQPQFPSYSYSNPYPYQASEISYRPIASTSNLASSNFGLAQTNTSDVLSGMPPYVSPFVGTQYILSQPGIPGYSHQYHSVMYSEEHLQMMHLRLPHHMTNFYSPNPIYPGVSSSLTGKETAGTGISNFAGYSPITDSKYARTCNYASPVSSTLTQQMGTMAHHQLLVNPLITSSYANYYGKFVIPAKIFQYDIIYPMAPAAYTTNHGTGATNTMSWYSNTAAASAGYNNVYETLGSSSFPGSSNDNGSSSKVGMSGQAQGNLAAVYSSISTLNKLNDKQQQSFQSPPTFSGILNNGSVGGDHSADSYAPVFVNPLPPGNLQPHHITPLHHQQEFSNVTDNNSLNQSINPTASQQDEC